MTRPRRSARITGLHRYHGAVRPYAAHRYSGPCGFCRSDGSLSRQWTPGPFRCARYRGAGSHVPHQSPGRARATSMPDTAWPVSRPPPGSSRARIPSPLSMSSIGFDTSAVVHSRSPSRPIPDALTARRFPQRSPPRPCDRRSLRWFAASPCRATTEDHQPRQARAGPSISDAASPHRIGLLHRFTSTFVAHEFPRFGGVLRTCGESAAVRMDTDAEDEACLSGVSSGGRRWSWSVRAARSRTSPRAWASRRRRCATGAARASATAASAITG